MPSNLETVQALYQAFGTGDIPFILGKCSATVKFDADWEDNSAVKSGLVKYHVPRIGLDGGAQLFTSIGECNMHDFKVLNIMSGGNQVAATVLVDFTITNGTHVRDEEVHLWTFNDAGEVVSMRHYVDTAKHLAAWSK